MDRIPEGSILASSYLSDPYGIRGVSGIRDLSDGNNVLNYVDPLTEFYRAGVDGASGISNYLAHNSEDSVYSYLNEKSDEFLEEHDFDRDEVKQGLESVISKYGVNGFTDIFTE